MGLKRAPVQTFARTSAAAEAYGELWEEVRGELGDDE
jgi:hypothetical protein